MNFLTQGLAYLAAPASQYGPGGGWCGQMMYGMGWLGGPFMIIFWILLIVAGVALIRWLFSASKKDSPGHPAGQAPDRALAILKERFARGEIDGEQYRAMKQELEA